MEKLEKPANGLYNAARLYGFIDIEINQYVEKSAQSASGADQKVDDDVGKGENSNPDVKVCCNQSTDMSQNTNKSFTVFGVEFTIPSKKKK